MTPDNPLPPGSAVIFEPNRSLKDKLGPNIHFGQIVPPETVQQAEKIILSARQEMLGEIGIELASIDRAIAALRPGQHETSALKRIGDSASAIIPKAGMCDYPFAARLAKMLHDICEHEDIGGAPMNPRTHAIISRLADGIKTTLARNLTGDGGATGAAILNELAKMTANNESA